MDTCTDCNELVRYCRCFVSGGRREATAPTTSKSCELKYGLYPYHCNPADVAALVRRLEALADPTRETTPSYADTDWRTLAGVAARVIKYLRGDDWRHGA